MHMARVVDPPDARTRLDDEILMETAVVWSDDDEPVDGTLTWSDDESVDLSRALEPPPAAQRPEVHYLEGPHDAWRRTRDTVNDLAKAFDGLENLARSSSFLVPDAEPAVATAAERIDAARREARRDTLVALERQGAPPPKRDAADDTLAKEERDIDAAHAGALAEMARKQRLADELALRAPDVPPPAAGAPAAAPKATDDDDDDSWSAFL